MTSNPIYRAAAKLLLFLSLVVVLQALINHIFPPFTTFDSMRDVEAAILDKKSEVVFFGDSSNYQTSPKDHLKWSIDQWVQHFAPKHRIAAMAHAGYAADTYLAHARFMLTKRPFPKVLIVPINLGSFGPVWERNPQFQFNEEKLILSQNPLAYLFYRPLTIFKFTNRISQEEFEMTPVYNGKQRMGVVKDFYNPDYLKHVTPEKIKNRMAFRYMYTLDKTHRKMKAIVSLTDLLVKCGITPIFYIEPIDWETGERHWPKAFVERVQQNVTLIKDVLAQKNIQPIDLSMVLGDESFIDGDYPQEHISEAGRQRVGKEIAKKLNAALQDAI